MLSDSDYVPSNSDTDSDIISIEEDEMDLSETDIADVTEDIMYLFNELVTANIQSLSSTKFYETMINDIVEIISSEWQEYGIADVDDDLFVEIQELVEQIVDFFVSSIGPRRSIKYASSLPETTKNSIVHQDLINKIRSLQNIPQPKQKTREWYEFRYGLISASNLWKVFGSEAQRNNLIAEKCVPFESFQSKNQYMNTESAMHWGNKYEPVTVMIYEIMFGTRVGEFGCIRHPEHLFIGASPDGINIDPANPALYGRMLEIKNIVNREITGIPKEEYWIQTQIQMETCDLDECDFMETRFKEYNDEDLFYEDEEHEYKGIILHFIERNLTKDSMPIYRYMPVELLMSRDKDEISEWITMERSLAKEEGLVLFTRIYWYLEEFSCVLIERNREWFMSVVPKIDDLWQQIIEKRKEDVKNNELTVVKLSI
uniref:YqaJ viral recombinase domain-containing protein n=1 Tax=viral metagenome TaxID=1070528 RepID=A0A6C0AT49_9ZZZZ